MIAREILLFLILFAAGLMIFVFVGIVWMTKIWEQMGEKYRQNVSRRFSQRALEKHGVKIR